jgi:hypothetical protein
MRKRNGLSLFLALITLLTACTPFQKENTVASTSDAVGNQIITPEKTTTQGLTEEITENRKEINPPVTVSFVKNQWSSDTEIITVDLTGVHNYAAIPVKKETVLKAEPAIDQEGNVYLLYGAHSTLFSKLGSDGNIETINVPNIGSTVDSVWIGNRLYIYKEYLLIVSTDMTIEEQPAINKLPDGDLGLGFLGLANETEKSLVWVARLPLREDDKLYAFYRTYNAKTGETYEGKLEIPYSIQDYTPTNNPDDRLGTIVMGVDTASKHVLLCYTQYPKDEKWGYSILELYDASTGEIVSSEQTCCSDTIITSSGENYFSNKPVESCGFDMVRRYSDGSDLIEFPPYAFPNLFRNWHGTNGAYWILMDKETLTVLDNSGKQLYEYSMPDGFPKHCSPPECISPAFLISQE